MHDKTNRMRTGRIGRRPGVTAAALLLAPVLTAHAQYVGKVGQGVDKKPILRATAVYEYTGSMTKPNASRLVPVVVWDGEHYQPGGLYLAQPEPLAVAPGTQYVLEQSGVPAGYFNIASAGQLAGAWVGLGRYAAEQPVAPPKKLAASRKLPALSGGSGRGRAGDDEESSSGPVLHRKAGSEGDAPPAGPSGSSKQSPPAGGDGPTLHRRDAPPAPGAGSTDTKSNAPAADPDRPTLHRSATTSTQDSAPAADPDRPTLHRHSDAAGTTAAAPDADRPHLRYGQPAELETRVLPAELKDLPADGVKVGEVAAVSDVSDDEPHPFHYAWPNTAAESSAEQAMHALALRALADSVKASFGPAARENAALKQAADAAEASLRDNSGAATRHKAPAAAVADPLADAEFHAFALSYEGVVTYVYTAHTGSPGSGRRYVTVIAQPDFYGKPHAVLAQTTRADMLAQTPALRLIDAVDADGDHRAELLFSQQTAPDAATSPENRDAGRQFALYSVTAGAATKVYATTPGAEQ